LGVSVYISPLTKDLKDELIANNCTATDALIYDIFLHCRCDNLKPV